MTYLVQIKYDVVSYQSAPHILKYTFNLKFQIACEIQYQPVKS
jgi:hypothetical protein